MNNKKLFYVEFNNLCLYNKNVRSWSSTIDNNYIFKIDIEFINCSYKSSFKVDIIKELDEKSIKEYAKLLFKEIKKIKYLTDTIIDNY